MQGLMDRHSTLSASESSTRETRNDANAKLMETATRMMKNGATPDVITFIETTITEVNQNILGVIVDEHDRDQALIDSLLVRFQEAVDAMEAACAELEQQHLDITDMRMEHHQCRQDEAVTCAYSRKCEEELLHLWGIVRMEETEMRRIHWGIHGEWCLGNAPEHPSLADPFHWTITEYKEGAETSESINAYPQVDLEDDVIEFRRFSVDYFGDYILQKPKVELAWSNYNTKLLECAQLEEVWVTKVDNCDGQQDAVHEKACEHASHHRTESSNFGHEYHMTTLAYNEAVTAIQQLEQDRKREWETLHITTCLLETVYTHVIHSIDSGEPCPTTESHPDQTAAEINTCHIVEDSLTVHLDINYGTPPTPPELPPVVPPPCTAEYIWEEHGSFGAEIEQTHRQSLEDEGLTDIVYADLSLYGWAGCAAPKACTHCEGPPVETDADYKEVGGICKHHHSHLAAGELDPDSFKCDSGDECISSAGRCNGFNNCADGSDEVGCHTVWGLPAVMHTEQCQEPFVSDVQFRCGDEQSTICTPVAAKCNGYNNCPDGSDEENCPTTTTSVTVEASTGFTATTETLAWGSTVFTDRTYTFDALGSFAGHSFVKMSNEDKYIRHSHIQAKLRFTEPTVVYVVKLDDKDLPWLTANGWTLTHLEGVTYHGSHETMHTEWITGNGGNLLEHSYGPGQVWEKIFTAGTVEMKGNEGGDGSYIVFVANPSHLPTPPAED